MNILLLCCMCLFIQAKRATNGRGTSLLHPWTPNVPYRHSIDGKHIFLYANFEVGLSVTRKVALLHGGEDHPSNSRSLKCFCWNFSGLFFFVSGTPSLIMKVPKATLRCPNRSFIGDSCITGICWIRRTSKNGMRGFRVTEFQNTRNLLCPKKGLATMAKPCRTATFQSIQV